MIPNESTRISIGKTDSPTLATQRTPTFTGNTYRAIANEYNGVSSEFCGFLFERLIYHIVRRVLVKNRGLMNGDLDVAQYPKCSVGQARFRNQNSLWFLLHPPGNNSRFGAGIAVNP